MLVAGAMCLLVVLLVVAMWAASALSLGRQVRAAADLVALAAAQVQATGEPGCRRAAQLAELNQVSLDDCITQLGDGEFVVTVHVSAKLTGLAGQGYRVRAVAAAGYLAED